MYISVLKTSSDDISKKIKIFIHFKKLNNWQLKSYEINKIDGVEKL